MKIRCIAASLITFALAGCASSGGSPDQSSTHVPAQKSSKYRMDDAYVARVEQIALRRGIRVQWVNTPTKRDRTDD